MDAAVRRRLADGFLIRRAVDVNVARVRIHTAAAIKAGFETFQPQDARGDLGVRQFRLRRVADDLARFENRSRRLARADFFRMRCNPSGVRFEPSFCPMPKREVEQGKFFTNLFCSKSETVCSVMLTMRINCVCSMLIFLQAEENFG